MRIAPVLKKINKGNTHNVHTSLLKIKLTRNPNWLRACASVHKCISSPHPKCDHDTEPNILIWEQVEKHSTFMEILLASLLLLTNLSWDINIELLFYLKCTGFSTPPINPHIKRSTESFLVISPSFQVFSSLDFIL